MSDLVQFKFNGKKLRSFYVNGESLLIAKDVCLAVGYSEKAIHNAIDKHVPPKYKLRFADIKGFSILTVPSNAQPQQILLKEPGLYCLLLRSKKEEQIYICFTTNIIFFFSKICPFS